MIAAPSPIAPRVLNLYISIHILLNSFMSNFGGRGHDCSFLIFGVACAPSVPLPMLHDNPFLLCCSMCIFPQKVYVTSSVLHGQCWQMFFNSHSTFGVMYTSTFSPEGVVQRARLLVGFSLLQTCQHL